MSDNIIKVSIGNVSLELQGSSEFVCSVFNDIRTNGFGKMYFNNDLISGRESQTANIEPEGIISTTKEVITENKTTNIENEIPNIRDLATKDPFPTEADWIIVYGFYASSQGSAPFTQDMIKQLYKESNRETTSRSKNFSTNIKKAIKNDFFRSLNDKELTLTQKGQENARQLIFNPSTSKKRQRNSNAKNYTENSFSMIDLNLNSEQKKTIKDAYSNYPKLTNMEKMIFAAYYLKSFCQLEEINPNHAYTILKIAGISTSFDIVSAFKNARTKGYISNGEENGTFKLTSFGTDRFEEINNGEQS